MNTKDLLEEIKGYYPDIPSNILPYYIQKALNYVMTLTNLSEVPITAKGIIIELVVIYFNKWGYEGLTSSSQGGNTLNWGTDIPQYLKSEINQFIDIRWV